MLVELRRIRSDLDDGRALLDGIDLVTVSDDGGLAAIADRAAGFLDDADRRARRSPVLRALSIVPGISGQVDAVRDLTGAVADVGERGREAAEGIERALDAGSGPEARLDVVRAARHELTTLSSHLETIELGADGWLIPPLRSARRSLAIALADARSDLDRSTTLATALERFLTGPRRYLILGGNNAEMRAVGIPTTSGVAEIAGGTIDVGEFSEATDAIEIPEPGVPVSLEYEALYGWLNGDRGYRTALATANWPVAAEISAAITERNQYGPVDGIIYVDTVTVALLLGVIGPVEVDGTTYDIDNVVPELLYENYLEFRTIDDNDARRSAQAEIAQAIFEAIDERDFDVLALAGQLSNLARSRHLLAWSADPEENQLWESFGADGALVRDGVAVVSQELGASKLDYFVRMAVDVDVRREDDHRRVTLTIDITNPKHPETSPYIDGGGIFAEPGEYGSFLVTYLPQRAYDIEGDPGFTYFGPDGPMYAVASVNRVPEDATFEATVTFSVPESLEVLTVLPSARLVPVPWTVGDEELDDRLPFEIDLTEID